MGHCRLFNLVYSHSVRRSRPPLKLSNSPLLLALAQARISPVLQMQNYIPAIQERLRRIGFPLFSEALMQEIVLGPGLPSPGSVVTRSKWVFADKARTLAVVIAPEFITLQTAAYDTFDAFSEQLAAVLDPISEIVGIELSERVGLRYVDYVQPRADDTLADYLAAGLVGLDPAMAGVRSQRSVYLAQGPTSVGQYSFRLTRSEGAFALPPDLQPSDVQVSPVGSPGAHAVLDIDHFFVATQPFKSDNIIQILWDLHDVVDGLFRSAITPHALQVWQAELREVSEA